eukprot:1150743-Pelagomonas_calceolata.AAC.3
MSRLGFRIYRLQASGVVACLATCAFNFGASSSADACWLAYPTCIFKYDVKFLVADGVNGLVSCGLLSQVGTCASRLIGYERARLLGGPNSGSSICRPARLALMLGAPRSWVLKSIPGFWVLIRGGGRYVGLGCVQQEVMSWVHGRSEKKRLRKPGPAVCIKERSPNGRSDACSVSGAFLFLGDSLSGFVDLVAITASV